LQWDAANWMRQPWTLFTSALVHLSGAHLIANLLALGALAILGWSLGAGKPACIALLAAWPLGTMALQAWPQVTQYGGLSGLVHAAVAVLWAHAAARGKAYPLSFVLFVALVFKLLTEHAWATPLAFDPDWGFNVVYAAHLSGTLAGAACGLVAAVWTRWLGSNV
jgi:rhomboid family GlyGly-CTERM serine protease